MQGYSFKTSCCVDMCISVYRVTEMFNDGLLVILNLDWRQIWKPWNVYVKWMLIKLGFYSKMAFAYTCMDFTTITKQVIQLILIMLVGTDLWVKVFLRLT